MNINNKVGRIRNVLAMGDEFKGKFPDRPLTSTVCHGIASILAELDEPVPA